MFVIIYKFFILYIYFRIIILILCFNFINQYFFNSHFTILYRLLYYFFLIFNLAPLHLLFDQPSSILFVQYLLFKFTLWLRYIVWLYCTYLIVNYFFIFSLPWCNIFWELRRTILMGLSFWILKNRFLFLLGFQFYIHDFYPLFFLRISDIHTFFIW